MVRQKGRDKIYEKTLPNGEVLRTAVSKGTGEIGLIKKVWKSNLPEHVRPEVLEAFYDVFHEDKDIFNDLRDR